MRSKNFDTPDFDIAAIQSLVLEKYGLDLLASPLPGEWDLNVMLSNNNGPVAVLKVSHAEQDRGWLEVENEALNRLASRVPEVAYPRVMLALSGESLILLTGNDGQQHLARLLSFVPGKLYAKARPHDRKLLRSLGRSLARVDKALHGFSHLLLRRPFKWDLSQALWIEDKLDVITPTLRRDSIAKIVETYKTHVMPRLPQLRQQAIYNDANDYNIFVTQGSVTGFVDMGDLVESARINELAIAAAYALMGQTTPLDAACELVAAYHDELPLTEDEIEVLWPLLQMRLAVSLVNSMLQLIEKPENDYLAISQVPAWELLERIASIHPRKAHYALRAACGLPVHVDSARVTAWFVEKEKTFASLLPIDPRNASYLPLDLSAGSLLLGGGAGWSCEHMEALLVEGMRARDCILALGGYLEPRLVYGASAFADHGLERVERRTVHLGVDLFMAAGTSVSAPLPGHVHSVVDNAGPGNYGPTVILAHTAGSGGPVFFTLYGHLDPGCLQSLKAGDAIAAGEVFAQLGRSEHNGGWPAHVHFQILLDLLEGQGDFPGAARPSESRLYAGLCPDPNLILGLSVKTSDNKDDVACLLAERQRLVGPSLSISYDEPLHMVRGFMQHLYDANGQQYLDMVNNVPHVGHANPHVVQAASKQLAVLNTNSRYLHPLMQAYAKRLTATLPAELCVCYFVNSGSEANELAVRLARTVTGRKGMVVVDAAYHGNTTTLIELSPYKHNARGGTGAPDWVQMVALPDAYRGRYQGADCGPLYGALVSDAITALDERGHAAAAFIAESMLGCGGQIVLPDGYLREAFGRIRARGGVCIADEVQVGFGRAGSHFWAFEQQGVVPDIVTMGKPIGNGWPLGAVVTTRAIAEAFNNGMEYFNTFGGNQASMAVGLAVLDEIQSRDLQTNALTVGNHIMAGLRNLQARHEVIGDVRGLGLYIGAELVKDRDTKEPFAAAATHVANRLRDFGVLISTDGPDHNVLKIKPPMVVNHDDAEQLLAVLDRAFSEDAAQTG